MNEINLTPVFEAVIALLAALITYKLVPWIKAKATQQQADALRTAATVAVYAAEQMFGHGENYQKLTYAIARLHEAGFTLDESLLREAIESQVYQMGLFRQATGKEDADGAGDAAEGGQEATGGLKEDEGAEEADRAEDATGGGQEEEVTE